MIIKCKDNRNEILAFSCTLFFLLFTDGLPLKKKRMIQSNHKTRSRVLSINVAVLLIPLGSYGQGLDEVESFCEVASLQREMPVPVFS